MMQGPKVSIIIPVYNAATTLKDTLQSVFTQSYPYKEIIVIDGGSTDGSQKIIEGYRSDIHYYISEKDAGVYDAMNKGIARSTGDWIYLLGADDQFASTDILQKVMDTAEMNDRLIFGKVENIDKQHPLVPTVHVSKMDRSLLFRNTIHQQSAFYHRSLFSQRKFNAAYKILADYDFHLFLYEQKIQGRYIDLVIAKCHAGGLSKSFNRNLYREEMEMKSRHQHFGLLFRIFYRPAVLLKFFAKKISG